MNRLLLCSRVDNEDPLPDFVPVPLGCVKMTCKDCGALIWVSPSSLVIMHDESVDLVCLACAGARHKAAGGIKLKAPTDGQLDEIKENYELFNREDY